MSSIAEEEYIFRILTEMNWVQRKIYLYNVTFGLYMLDWWERYLFSILFSFKIHPLKCTTSFLFIWFDKFCSDLIFFFFFVKFMSTRAFSIFCYLTFVGLKYWKDTLVVVLMWFICYNTSRYVADVCRRWALNVAWRSVFWIILFSQFCFGKYKSYLLGNVFSIYFHWSVIIRDNKVLALFQSLRALWSWVF